MLVVFGVKDVRVSTNHKMQNIDQISKTKELQMLFLQPICMGDVLVPGTHIVSLHGLHGLHGLDRLTGLDGQNGLLGHLDGQDGLDGLNGLNGLQCSLNFKLMDKFNVHQDDVVQQMDSLPIVLSMPLPPTMLPNTNPTSPH